MLATPRTAVTLLALLGFASGCGGGSAAQGAHSATDGKSPVAQRRSDDHPPLVLVARAGDPHGAVAFAAAHDLGASASAATATLLATRLRERGVAGVRSRAQALGFTLDAPVENGAEARRFVEAVRSALDAPARPGEPALDAAQAALVALSSRRVAGPGTAAVADCSGELAVHADEAALDRARLPGAVTKLLTEVRSVERSAFAAVGSDELLEGTEDALSSGSDWPDGSPVDDAWPERSITAADFAGTETRRLSVALRLASPGAALGAAEALGNAESVLSRRLEALRPPWRLERASATARPRGACLRVDAVPPAGDPGPSSAEIAKVLVLVSDETDRALAEASRRGESALEEAVVRPTDPGDAASAAAWRGLANRLPAGSTRRFVAYSAPATDRGRVDLGRAMAEHREALARPIFETRVRSESGQSGFWLLAASTCGTASESRDDAGEAASLVSALALGRHGATGVVFEPWIAPDGVGLLAHAPRASASELPGEHARRVASALGELIATTRPAPTARLTAREELLDALGRTPRPGLSLMLEELSQGHPSWLEPRGTVAALGAAASQSFDAALQHWLASPLRLSVLANGDGGQAEVARRELERWISPVRGEALRCPPAPRLEPKTGELTLQTTPGEITESAYLGVPLARFEGRMPLEARAALFLMNRTGGWLERALADLPATASATALGGPRAAALLVRLAAPPEQREPALARVRALFDRFPAGVATAADVALADRELARADGAERRDPRRRIVELWRGGGPPARLEAARLAKFLAEVGRAGRLVVLVVPPNG
ncbi:MAG TPA: hypothetical protein VFZ53_33100 [Polyangiaceae bacterium]